MPQILLVSPLLVGEKSVTDCPIVRKGLAASVPIGSPGSLRLFISRWHVRKAAIFLMPEAWLPLELRMPFTWRKKAIGILLPRWKQRTGRYFKRRKCIQ